MCAFCVVSPFFFGVSLLCLSLSIVRGIVVCAWRRLGVYDGLRVCVERLPVGVLYFCLSEVQSSQQAGEQASATALITTAG